MKRKQIYLEEDADQQLKTMAMRHGCSEASLIREAVTQFLKREDRPAAGDEDSPLSRMIGMVKKGRRDSALRHDQYLYQQDE